MTIRYNACFIGNRACKEEKQRTQKGAVDRMDKKLKKRRGFSGSAESRIFEAADSMFCEQGYTGVSIRDIAHRAEVNKASVFYYFRSKEELFEGVLKRYYEAHRLALQESYEVEGSHQERLHRMIDAYFDFMLENQRYARLIQQQVAELNTHELIEKNLAPLFLWITEVLSELTPQTGSLAARHFFVTFSGMVINYFTYTPLLKGVWGEDPLSPESLKERRGHLHWLVETVLKQLNEESTCDVERASSQGH